MSKICEAIFFDLGGTFRILQKDRAYQENAMKKIVDLVGTDIEPDSFHKLLDERYEVYRQWAIDNMIEAPEATLWTRWLTPEYPKNRIVANAAELTLQYRNAKGKRQVIKGGEEVIKTLYNRGYTLGIISNLIGCHEIQDWLEEDKLKHYFKAVLLSSVTCIRKPDPSIFIMAAQEIGVEPIKCACIGDNSRDIIGGKAAGFGLNIAVSYPDNPSKEEITEENRPDTTIHSFDQLLDIVPRVPKVNIE